MATSADGVNEWKYRTALVEQTLKKENLDVIGMQEVLHTQLVDIQKMLPDYDYYGVGREDFQQKGEYAAIFYKKNKFSNTNRILDKYRYEKQNIPTWYLSNIQYNTFSTRWYFYIKINQ